MADETPLQLARLHRAEVERIPGLPSSTPKPPPVELPPATDGDPAAGEWLLFLREVARLLGEGHQGRFALVKEGHAITVWDTLGDAARAGRLLYGSAPCVVQEIQPYLRPMRVGGRRTCRD